MVELLQHPVIRSLALSGAVLCFTATAFDAVFVLFCYTPIHLGGLSFTVCSLPFSFYSVLSVKAQQAFQIGYALAIAGISSILLQITLLPALLVKLDHARLYSICMFFWPLTYLAFPLLSITARRGVHEGALGLNLHLNSSRSVPGANTSEYNPYAYGSWRVGNMANDDSEAEQARLTRSATYLVWLGIFLIMIMSRIGCLAYSCVSVRLHVEITKKLL
jgi:hypothetical protein